MTALLLATILSVVRADHVKMMVSDEDTQPALIVMLPGTSEAAARILFPEHVTVRRHGSAVVEHLYLFRPGAAGESPNWRCTGNALEYERDLPGPVHMLARATLQDDGILFHYEFTNRSAAAYDMIYAVTDPRLQSIFHDVRLERTYVHHSNGFELLASETPARLTMPLDQWLPARYLVSYTWPVPAKLVDKRDGITYYNKSRRVDEPLIATLSTDHQWVVASFTRDVGNVWSNPELTCQHVDPQAELAPHGKAILEVKMLLMRGSLDDVQKAMLRERGSLVRLP